MNIEKKKPGCLAQIVMCFVIMGLITCFIIYNDKQKRNETPEIRREAHCGARGKSAADAMAKQFVMQRLKAPSTAKFAWYNETSVLITGACEYTIQSYVDAQNSFGAMIRNQYSAEVRYDPIQDTYMAVDIQIGN